MWVYIPLCLMKGTPPKTVAAVSMLNNILFNMLNICLTEAQSPKPQTSWEVFDWSKPLDLQQRPSFSIKVHRKNVFFINYLRASVRIGMIKQVRERE